MVRAREKMDAAFFNPSIWKESASLSTVGRSIPQTEPPGKKGGKSLREEEDDITKMKNSGISPDSKVTIRDIVTELCDIRVQGNSASTKRTYSGLLTHSESEPMFSERVTNVTPRNAEIWILSLLYKGIGYYDEFRHLRSS